MDVGGIACMTRQVVGSSPPAPHWSCLDFGPVSNSLDLGA